MIVKLPVIEVIGRRSENLLVIYFLNNDVFAVLDIYGAAMVFSLAMVLCDQTC